MGVGALSRVGAAKITTMGSDSPGPTEVGPRSRPLRFAAVAGVAAAVGGSLYAYALVDARVTACPTQVDGLELLGQRVSSWPPGAECRASDGSSFVFEPHPWLTTAIAALAILAVALLTVAAIASLLGQATPPRRGVGPSAP